MITVLGWGNVPSIFVVVPPRTIYLPPNFSVMGTTFCRYSLYELPKSFNYDRTFEYYLKTKSILFLPKENWVPMDKFIYDLSIFKNRLATIGLAFFHAPLKLTKEDFDFMLNLMK
jgi:hypothetical protein